MKAALYVRLSRDDDNGRESESIGNQKIFLRQYAEENGFTVVNCFVDEHVIKGTNGESLEFAGLQTSQEPKNEA